ncbi:MAG: WD40/YVTN/BNR-like repeat-containing protein [Phycisphaerales bacterium]
MPQPPQSSSRFGDRAPIRATVGVTAAAATASLGFITLTGCETTADSTATLLAARAAEMEARYPGTHAETPAVLVGPVSQAGRRPNDVGPPPPGHPRIIGDIVPNWSAEAVFGQAAGLSDAGNPMNYTPVGPRPIVSEFWSGNDDASGRVVGITPHPTNPDIVYIVSASGGAWKTVDRGDTWTPLTDELPTLNGGALAIHPVDHDTIFLGTGEYQTRSRGDGIFRSTDGGTTWDQLTTAAAIGDLTSVLLIDPTDPQVMHHAGRGYHRSADGGQSWTSPIGSDRVSSLVMDAANPLRLLAGQRGEGVLRSLDGGLTWTDANNGLPSSGISRVELATSPANPQRAYVAIANGGTVTGTWRTDNFGSSWTLLPNTPSFATPQASYDMYLAADPADADTVYAGGVSPIYAEAGIIRSTDGGENWAEISSGTTEASDQTHPDHHTMAFGPDGTIWEGNDGGVWRSSDGGDTWVNRNGDLMLTQQYTVGISPFPGARILGGTQDNGSIERVDENSMAWPQLIGGDGGYLAYSHADPGVKYTTYVRLSVQRWIDGAFSNISGPWQGDARGFISPLSMDPVAADTLYGGTDRLWRTTNASGDADWETISTGEIGGSGVLTAIAPAPDGSGVIYTGSSTGEVWQFNGREWIDRGNSVPDERITDIVVSPDNPNVAYLSMRETSGVRVMQTTFGGAFWANVTGDLPNGLGATALAVDWRTEPPTLFVGTGAGVLVSFDNGGTWIKDGADLPNVNIGDLFVDLERDHLIVGTYGRGTWTSPLPDPAPPACFADFDGNGSVDILDLLTVLSSFGVCPGCPADLDEDGVVGFTDTLAVLGAWGACE